MGVGQIARRVDARSHDRLGYLDGTTVGYFFDYPFSNPSHWLDPSRHAWDPGVFRMRDLVESARYRYSLWERGAHILVACSGGPDSLSLLHLLHRERDYFGISVSAAHLNHGLRDESVEDEKCVESFCREEKIPYIADRLSNDFWETEGRAGWETKAREARYSFLNKAKMELSATHVATAHTASDNVETFLLSLLRGAGMEGLSGIPPKRGDIIRPLLLVWREDVEKYCTANKLHPRIDATNQEHHTLRNWIRSHLIPELEEKSSGFQKRIFRTIEVMRDEWKTIQDATQQARSQSQVSKDSKRVILHKKSLLGMSRADLRRVIRSVVEDLGVSLQEIGFEETEMIIKGITSGNGLRQDFPGGIRVEKGPETVGFFRKDRP